MSKRTLYAVVTRGQNVRIVAIQCKETPKTFKFERVVGTSDPQGRANVGYIGRIDKIDPDQHAGAVGMNSGFTRMCFYATPRQAKTAMLAYLKRETEALARRIDELSALSESLRVIDPDFQREVKAGAA